MAEKHPEQTDREVSQTLTESDIVTERTVSRRSFLTATGALLAGAVALASGVRAMAQEQGPDPDSKKKRAKKRAKKGAKKGADPDKKKKAKKTPAGV